jgi:hypothetical protein
VAKENVLFEGSGSTYRGGERGKEKMIKSVCKKSPCEDWRKKLKKNIVGDWGI